MKALVKLEGKLPDHIAQLPNQTKRGPVEFRFDRRKHGGYVEVPTVDADRVSSIWSRPQRKATTKES